MAASDTAADEVEIVSPEGRLPDRRFALAERPTSLDGVTLGILDNAKPNADHLLHAVAEHLQREHGVAGIVERSKNVSGVPASPEAVRAIAAECAVVLTGSGD